MNASVQSEPGTPGSRKVARAQRFPIKTSLRYRESGQEAWIESSTINISRSGVLFHADRVIPPKAMLDLVILFPAQLTHGLPATVACRGQAVRHEAPDAVAAAIRYYRLASHCTA